MRVDQALEQVQAIQWQIARAESYVNLRSLATAASGILAIAAAAAQPLWIANAAESPLGYVSWWVAVALVAITLTSAEMAVRWRWFDSDFTRRQTLAALRQFAPCLIAGGATTIGIAAFRLEFAEMLPALWATFFGLGIFSARRQLPPAAALVALFYLAMALVIFWHGVSASMLEPWTMGATFGIGQLLLAAALHARREALDETG